MRNKLFNRTTLSRGRLTPSLQLYRYFFSASSALTLRITSNASAT